MSEFHDLNFLGISLTAIAYDGKLFIAAQADSSWMTPKELENWLLQIKVCINEMAKAQTFGEQKAFTV